MAKINTNSLLKHALRSTKTVANKVGKAIAPRVTTKAKPLIAVKPAAAAAAVNPYTSLQNQYRAAQQQVLNNNLAQLQNTRTAALNAANANAANLANNAYVNMMQAKRRQGDIASSYGMTGGAIEKMNVGNLNNYNRNVANVQAGKVANVANANAAYEQGAAEARNTYNNNIANNAVAMGQARIERADTLKQNKQTRLDNQRAQNLQIYADTVSRYTTIRSVDKAIASMRKSKDPQRAQKVAYLQQQRAAIKAQAKEEKRAKEAAQRAAEAKVYKKLLAESKKSKKTSKKK